MDNTDSFTTVAGFVLFRLGHVPQAGEDIFGRNWRFEVMDMDGTRIDKLLVSKAKQESTL
jgi:CBS domain containing-hemolysin-like protein